ncbi:UPF0149 family protein [Luteimonas saliphila]|uniref:UPF0149 family protein n=1 Tax=Luteimonas saliphila TaxID=2804919 RepID=UPI00192E2E89|nr:UPF0149 family protein [Luteimonas saliphila]
MSAVPMSEDAIREFEHLLGEKAVPNGGMTLEWVDGYFSALIVGPATVSPARQLSRIWGVAMAEADEAGATAMLEATVAFWNHIVWRVAQPLPDEDAEPDPADMQVMPLLQTPAFDEDADQFPDSVRDFRWARCGPTASWPGSGRRARGGTAGARSTNRCGKAWTKWHG